MLIWVRRGVDCGPFSLKGDRWHEKTETKIQNIIHWVISHNRAMTNSYMGHIDGHHTDYIKMNLGCRGCSENGLG